LARAGKIAKEIFQRAPLGISESERRRLAAERRANVLARRRTPQIISAEHLEVEKIPAKWGAQLDSAFLGETAHRTPSVTSGGQLLANKRG
jgi:hypothetical protein